LGIYITPSLCWDRYFQSIRKKAHKLIMKLMNINIAIDQAYIYFNIYFLLSVYFGVGIISLNEKQEKEIKCIYKELILRKLGLSIKYLKELLYERRGTLGVGFLSSNTALTITSLKLYIGNQRMQSRVSELINVNEQYNHILSGSQLYPIAVNTNNTYWKYSWIDQINKVLNKREIKVKVTNNQ